MRICKNCQIEKNITAFPFRKAPNGVPYRKHTCSACKSKKWRQKSENKQRCANTRKKYREKYDKTKIRNELFSHIKQNCCCKCGNNDFRVLCFHHRDPKEKEFEIKWGFTHYKPLKSLIPEAEKCDLLCQNCHLLVHYKGTGYNAKKRKEKKTCLMSAIKQEKCKHCGNNNLPCLTFHHRSEAKKQFTLSNKMHRPLPELLQEAVKCDILCANCHVIHHY